MKRTRITLASLTSILTVMVMLVGSLSLFAPSADAKKKKKKKQSCVVNKNSDYRFRVHFFDDSGKKIKAKTLEKATMTQADEVCGPRGSSVVVVTYENDRNWRRLHTILTVQENKCARGIYNAENKKDSPTTCKEYIDGSRSQPTHERIPELAITDAALVKMKAVQKKEQTIFRGKLGVGGYNHLCFFSQPDYPYYPILMYKGREGNKCRNKRKP